MNTKVLLKEYGNKKLITNGKGHPHKTWNDIAKEGIRKWDFLGRMLVIMQDGDIATNNPVAKWTMKVGKHFKKFENYSIFHNQTNYYINTFLYCFSKRSKMYLGEIPNGEVSYFASAALLSALYPALLTSE